MAGSQSEQTAQGPFPADPILAARMEAIAQLAGGLADRVSVMDRDFNIVYANEAGWPGLSENVPADHSAKCYEAFANRTDPCEACPASKVFEAAAVQSIACGNGMEGASCGMHQAFPLLSSDGTVGSMLVLFKSQARSLQDSVPAVQMRPPTPEGRMSLGELLGRSAVMQQLFDTMVLVADSPATVLIQGDSGTGKELVAKTLHRLSCRRDKPFVVVDCGSLPETLLESELFGHMKGAFTGATTTKRGLFEEADGGTIFLDEIADTTPAFQAKLLRVLQEGEVKRVGGNQPIKVDVRVVSATNKDLVELVKVKSFRQDLYYRLAVLPLYLPPLRERREDIPLLVEHFVAASCARHRQPIRTVSPEVMQALSEAAWLGNVRELQHYIERAVVTTTGSELSCKDVVALGLTTINDDGLRTVVRDAVSQTERARIIDALKKTGGNRLRAAKILKISRASLYNKLRDYGLQDR